MMSRDQGAGPVFFDDFRAPDLNRSSWNVWTTGPVFNDELQAYVDSPETVRVVRGEPTTDDGALELRALHRPGHSTDDGRRFDFISGRIDTRGRFAFRHGRAAARIRLPAGPGLWPAFWLLGSGSWPASGEIDVLESVGEPDWVSCAVHGPGYSGDAGLVNRWYFDDGTNATAWHTYSVDVTSGSVSFEVDGRLVYRVTRPITEYFGSWPFDSEKFLVLNLALGGTYPYKANGSRDPYGLPSETVESIRRDEARVLVDWIRVDVLK